MSRQKVPVSNVPRDMILSDAVDVLGAWAPPLCPLQWPALPKGVAVTAALAN